MGQIMKNDGVIFQKIFTPSISSVIADEPTSTKRQPRRHQ